MNIGSCVNPQDIIRDAFTLMLIVTEYTVTDVCCSCKSSLSLVSVGICVGVVIFDPGNWRGGFSTGVWNFLLPSCGGKKDRLL